MRIFITGIRGYLGSHLETYLAARGHLVSGSFLSGGPPPRLNELFDEAIFAGIDVIVHCAHDFAADAATRNIAGARAWLEAGAKQGVRQQIYLSSYSARADAVSGYGRTKYAVERLFLDAGQTVVRPGLVIGAGGLYAKQRAALLRTPVVPLIGGGRQPVASIGIGHFTEAVAAIAEAGRTGAFNLFYEPPATAREFARAVKASQKRRAILVPVPVFLALGLARAAQLLRLPLPAQPDQIRALAANSSAPWRSDLAALLPGKAGEFTLEHALSLQSV